MTRFRFYFALFWFVVSAAAVGAAENNALPVDQILDGMEKRYAGSGFAADFFQESMLKALQITDTAEGTLTVKRPGKMRWEYIVPDPQVIITDGQSLWIYRPTDNQVMVGAAPEFFSQGKGAGFLSDIRLIRESFIVEQQPAENETYFRLRLLPRKPNNDIAELILSIDKQSFQVDQVVTRNAYGDKTRIVLNNYRFNVDPDDALFNFSIPEGVDVVQIDGL